VKGHFSVEPVYCFLQFRPMVTTGTLLLSFALYACAMPMRVSGYVPTGLGELKNTSCILGKNDALRITALDGVQIIVSAGKYEVKGTTTLNIDLLLPNESTVRLLSPTFVLQSAQFPTHRLTVTKITAPGPHTYDAMAELRALSPLSNAFTLWFASGPAGATSVPIVDSFTLQFPDMRINNQIYRIEPIKFASYNSVGLAFCVQ